MVAAKPVDFRKGMDSLAALVMQALSCDPFAGDVFIFRSKRSDRLKLLVWDGSGLCLVTKRLESGGFIWPPVQDGGVTLTPMQLHMLFSGMNWTQLGVRAIAAPAG
jgi:transposase